MRVVNYDIFKYKIKFVRYVIQIFYINYIDKRVNLIDNLNNNKVKIKYSKI